MTCVPFDQKGKGVSTMKLLESRDIQKLVNVLKLEIDYELTTLHDALEAANEEQIQLSKEKLEKYRRELFFLNKQDK